MDKMITFTEENLRLKRDIVFKYINYGLASIYEDKEMRERVEEVVGKSTSKYLTYVFGCCGLTLFSTKEGLCIHTAKETLKRMVEMGCTQFYPLEKELIGKEFDSPTTIDTELLERKSAIVDFLVQKIKSMDKDFKKEYLDCKNKGVCSDRLSELIRNHIYSLEIVHTDDYSTPYVVKSDTKTKYYSLEEDSNSLRESLWGLVLYRAFYGSISWLYSQDIESLRGILHYTGNLYNACTSVLLPEKDEKIREYISSFLLNLETRCRFHGITCIKELVKDVYRVAAESRPMTGSRIVFQGNIDKTVTCIITNTAGHGGVCLIDRTDTDKITSRKKKLLDVNVGEDGFIYVGKRRLWEIIYGKANPINGDYNDFRKKNIN